MTILVADVGGTNTRIALTAADGAPESVARYRNDDFAAFADVLTRFCRAHDVGNIAGCCVAVAGPVTADHARLTNRDWSFHPQAIAAALPAPVAVHLVNDLVALGYALPALRPSQLSRIRPAAPGRALNDQALVAGLGTGFNICMTKSAGGTPTVIEAELGHASLPASVCTALGAAVGKAADGFAKNEDLFSGRGLAGIYRILSQGDTRQGPRILAAYDSRNPGPATRATDLLAHLLGVFARELVFQYLPFAGIYFAGGVARAIVATPARAEFLRAFTAAGPFDDLVSRVPVRVITDDAAALVGAARFLRRSQKERFGNGKDRHV
jgi:glucokinase